MDIADKFAAADADYLNFEVVENKRSQRPDLHAYLLLDELFPCNEHRDMICAASHDEIWMDINEKQMEQLTTERILELVRCGVRYDEDNHSLVMFV